MENISKLKVNELKEKLQEYGLPTDGLKNILRKKLIQFYENDQVPNLTIQPELNTIQTNFEPASKRKRVTREYI